MPRYYFAINDGSAQADHEVMKLPNSEAAYAMALRTSGEIIGNLDPSAWTKANVWEMHLTDETGRLMLVLRFSASSPVA